MATQIDIDKTIDLLIKETNRVTITLMNRYRDQAEILRQKGKDAAKPAGIDPKDWEDKKREYEERINKLGEKVSKLEVIRNNYLKDLGVVKDANGNEVRSELKPSITQTQDITKGLQKLTQEVLKLDKTTFPEQFENMPNRKKLADPRPYDEIQKIVKRINGELDTFRRYSNSNGQIYNIKQPTSSTIGIVQPLTQLANQVESLGSSIGLRIPHKFNGNEVTTDVSEAKRLKQRFDKATKSATGALRRNVTASNTAISPTDIISVLGNTPQEAIKAIGDAIYFDLETVGQIGKTTGRDRIVSTQISMTYKNAKNISKTINSYVTLDSEIEKRLREALANARSGKGITRDEQRELLSFANASINRQGNIQIGDRYKFDDNFKLGANDTELLDAIERGITTFSSSSKANNRYETSTAAWNAMTATIQKQAKIADMSQIKYAGHKIQGFDVRVLESEGLRIKNQLIDTLDLARQYVKLGAENKVNVGGQQKTVQLTGYNMDDLGKFLGLTIDETMRHSAGYDTYLNQLIGEALIEYIGKTTGDFSKLSQKDREGIVVKKNQLFQANKNYFKENGTSFRVNNGKIVSDEFGKWLLKAGEVYTYSGLVKDDKNENSYTMKMTGIASQDEVYFTGTKEQLQQILSNVFGENIKPEKGLTATDKSIQLATKGLLEQIFKGGRFSFANVSRMKKDNTSEWQFLQKNLDNVLGSGAMQYINDAIDKVNAAVKGDSQIDDAKRQALWEAIGTKSGIIQTKQANASRLDSYITKGVARTFTGFKQAYIKFIEKEFEGELKDQLIEIVNSPEYLERTSDERIKNGDTPFYNVSALMLNKLREQRSQVLGEISSGGTDITNVVTNSSDLDDFITDALKVVNPVDITQKIVNSQSKSAAYKAKAYTGEYSAERMKNRFKYTNNKTVSQLTSKVNNGGIYSVQSTIEEIIREANKKGLSTEIGVTAEGDIQIGFYPTTEHGNVRDEKGNPLWDKMAKVTIGLADEFGTVNANGLAKTNFNIVKANDDGSATMITAQEQQALNILDIVRNTGFAYNLNQYNNVEIASKQLRKGIRDVFNFGSATFAGKVNGDTAEVSKVGTTETQKRYRESAVAWGDYLKGLLINAKKQSNVSKDITDMITENQINEAIQAMLQIVTVLNSQQDPKTYGWTELEEVLINDPYIYQALDQVAKQFNFSYMSTNEDQLTSLVSHQIGSGDFEIAGWARDEASRATTQGYNAVSDYKKVPISQAIVNGAIQTVESSAKKELAKAKESNFEKGGVNSKADDRMTLTLGYVNDKLLAKAKQIFDEKYSKDFGTLDLSSVAEGGIILGSNVAKGLEGYYLQRYEAEAESVDETLKGITAELAQNGEGVIENVLEAGSVSIGKDAYGREIWANAGDKIVASLKDGVYNFSISRAIGTERGTKLVGGGNRVAVNSIYDNENKINKRTMWEAFLDSLTEATGGKRDFSKAQALVEDTEIKASNVGDLFQQRLEYFINRYIKMRQSEDANVTSEQARKEFIEKYQKSVKNGEIGKGLKANGNKPEDLENLRIVKEALQNLLVLAENGKISEATTEEQQNAILNNKVLGQEFVNIFGENGLVSKIGRAVFEQNWDTVKKEQYTSTQLNPAANEYPYWDSMGDNPADQRESKHRVKLGVKEIDALHRLSGLLRRTREKDEELDKINGYNDITFEEASIALNQLIEDLRNRQSDRTKHLIEEGKRIANQLEQTINGEVKKTENDLIITNGQNMKTGTGNELLSIEDFTRRISEYQSSGGVSQVDYELTPVGIINEALKNSGLDRAILDLSGLGLKREVINTNSRGEAYSTFAELNELIIPQVDPNKIDDVYMLDEINKATSELFRALNDKTGSSIEIKKRIQDAVDRYLQTMRSVITNKQGAYFQAMTTVTPPNATATRVIGINRDNSEFIDSNGNKVKTVDDFYQNAIIMGTQQAKEILQASGMFGDNDKDRNKRKVHLQELFALAGSVKGDLSKVDKKNIDDWENKKNDLDEFKKVEAEIINAILEAVKFNGDFSKDQKQYLVNFFHRFPSIGGLDEVLAKVLVKDDLENGTMMAGEGIIEQIKGDFDGDKIRTWLGLGGNKGDSFDERGFAATEAGKRDLEKLFSKIAVDVAKGTQADATENLAWGEGIDTATADKLLTSLKSKKFTGLMSRFNRANIGSLSNNASELRSLLFDTGLDERGIVAADENTLRNAAYSELFRALFEHIEQDAISSKKISKRLIAHAGKKGAEMGDTSYENQEKIIMDEINQLADLERNRKFSEVIKRSIGLGIFDSDVVKGQDGDQILALSTARARAVISLVQNGLGEAGKKVLEEIAVKDDAGNYIGISQAGLSKIVTEMDNIYQQKTGRSMQYAPRNHNINNPTKSYNSARFTDILNMMGQGFQRPTTQTSTSGRDTRFTPEYEARIEDLKSRRFRGETISDAYKAWLANKIADMTDTEKVRLAIKIFPEMDIDWKDESRAIELLNNLVGKEHIEAVEAARKAELGKADASEVLTDRLEREKKAIADVNAEANKDKVPLTYSQFYGQYGSEKTKLEYTSLTKQDILDSHSGKASILSASQVMGHLNNIYPSQKDLDKENIIKRNKGNYEDLKDGADNVWGSQQAFEKDVKRFAATAIGDLAHLFYQSISESGRNMNELGNLNEDELQKEFTDFLKSNKSAGEQLRALEENYGIQLEDLHFGDNIHSLIDAMNQLGIKFTGVSEFAVGLNATLSDGSTMLTGGILDALVQDSQGNFRIMDYKTGEVRDEYIVQLSIYTEALKQLLNHLQNNIGDRKTSENTLLLNKLLGEDWINKSDEEVTKLIHGVNILDGVLAQIRDGKTTLYETNNLDSKQIGAVLSYARRKENGGTVDNLDENTVKRITNGGLGYGVAFGGSDYSGSIAEMLELNSSNSNDERALRNYYAKMSQAEKYRREIAGLQAQVDTLDDTNEAQKKEKEELLKAINLRKQIVDSLEKQAGQFDIGYRMATDDKGKQKYVNKSTGELFDVEGLGLSSEEKKKVLRENGSIQSVVYKDTVSGTYVPLTDSGITKYLERDRQFQAEKVDLRNLTNQSKIDNDEVERQIKLVKELIALEKENANIQEALKNKDSVIVQYGPNSKEVSELEKLNEKLKSNISRIEEITSGRPGSINLETKKAYYTSEGKDLSRDLSAEAVLEYEKYNLAKQKKMSEQAKKQMEDELKALRENVNAKKKEYLKLYEAQEKAYTDVQKAQQNLDLVKLQNNGDNSDVAQAKITQAEAQLEEASKRWESLQQETSKFGNEFENTVVQLGDEAESIRKEVREAQSRINTEQASTRDLSSKDNAVKMAEARQKQRNTETRNADKDISNYLANYKKQRKLEQDIQYAQNQMQNVSDPQRLKSLQNYVNILSRQKQVLEGMLPAYDRENKTLNGIKLTQEQIEKLEKGRSKILDEHEAKIAKQNATFKKQIPLIDQLIGAFKNVLQNVSIYSIAQRMFNQVEQGFRQVIQSAQELDKALVDIRIASGMNTTEANGFMVSLNKLGKQLGMTTQEMAEASNDWLRAGYEMEEAVDLTKASASLAQLGMINTADATSYLISSLKGWKLEASEVMGVVDKLTAVDMSAAISAGDLASAMARANNSAQQSGVSMNKYIGYLATVSDITQRKPESVKLLAA